ncbi:type II secretion system F family protein [Arthrobacter cupressi]
MTVLLVLALAASAWLAIGCLPGPGRGTERTAGSNKPAGPGRRRSRKEADLPLAVLVQQLAALLRGGRSASRLWEEAWIVHGHPDETSGAGGSGNRQLRQGLSNESVAVLAAARSASMLGVPAAAAIRTASASPRIRPRERRIWGELADCLDLAQASGCPLADVLGRYAAHLEAEDDAEAARQTALAGPKATVRLLSWLPLFGLALGTVLGVDPLGILLGNPFGLAALGAGIVLTVAGRVWSMRLVRAATGDYVESPGRR